MVINLRHPPKVEVRDNNTIISSDIDILDFSQGLKVTADSSGKATISAPIGYLQYRNANDITTNAVAGVNAVLDTDTESFANSRFTKSSTTEFRTDFAGYVKISAHVTGYPNANDRGYYIEAWKNGSPIPGSRVYGNGKSQIERTSAATLSLIATCAVNDLFTLRIVPLEATTVTVPANLAKMTIELYRLSAD